MGSEKMMPEEEQSEPIFDPKSFLETLFRSSEAEIQVIFHNSTHNNTDTVKQESDHDDFKPDLYFVIGAVSFVLFLVIFWATCKAIQMLKISLDDGIDDTVPVPDRRSPNENVQSVASGHFLAGGLRQFHANLTNASATLRSRTSLKSEDDLPPPYDSEELATSPSADPQAPPTEDTESQQSPPPYHVAISMSEVELPQEDIPESEDETDSKVNLTAKRMMAKLTR